MKKIFIIALVAVATVFAVSCDKEGNNVPNDTTPEDNTLTLPGTSWACDLEATLMGTSVVINDTLNIIDDQTVDRHFHFAAAGNEMNRQIVSGYSWNDTVLVLLDSVGQPTGLALTYRESDNVFFRNAGDDHEMGQIFDMMGIEELTYRKIN